MQRHPENSCPECYNRKHFYPSMDTPNSTPECHRRNDSNPSQGTRKIAVQNVTTVSNFTLPLAPGNDTPECHRRNEFSPPISTQKIALQSATVVMIQPFHRPPKIALLNFPAVDHNSQMESFVGCAQKYKIHLAVMVALLYSFVLAMFCLCFWLCFAFGLTLQLMFLFGFAFGMV